MNLLQESLNISLESYLKVAHPARNSVFLVVIGLAAPPYHYECFHKSTANVQLVRGGDKKP